MVFGYGIWVLVTRPRLLVTVFGFWLRFGYGIMLFGRFLVTDNLVTVPSRERFGYGQFGYVLVTESSELL